MSVLDNLVIALGRLGPEYWLKINSDKSGYLYKNDKVRFDFLNLCEGYERILTELEIRAKELDANNRWDTMPTNVSH